LNAKLNLSTGTKGLVIASPKSGSGKTLITLGLLRHIANTGIDVVSAKVGPDYIDPAFHTVASGRPCRNLDSWGMRPKTLKKNLDRIAVDGSIVICEGVMGLFDGARVDPTEQSGSTADIALFTGWPVVLVADADAQGASAAALVRGFATHHEKLQIAGVIFNRVGSETHAEILISSMTNSLPHIPVLGCIPRGEALSLPSRHLGLIQAIEHPDLEVFIENAATIVKKNIDITEVLALAYSSYNKQKDCNLALPVLGQHISIAKDDAFNFVYPHVLEGWQDMGAEISTFSPLANEIPKACADAIYLPGGYPELYGGQLAANRLFISSLIKAADKGVSIFGECGGYMVLGRGLVDARGTRHTMAGLLALETSFEHPRLHLGYRNAQLATDSPLGSKGSNFRGHEFHYSTIIFEDNTNPLFVISDAAGSKLGTSGLQNRSVMGSFIHLIDQH
tara:strand:+ start:746 stop:2095 length:1350 start_codon:yes stop_codon:yes gene_type:complete